MPSTDFWRLYRRFCSHYRIWRMIYAPPRAARTAWQLTRLADRWREP